MREVIILGGGYSVKEGIDKGLWDKIKGLDIWALNVTYKTMPYLPNKELWVDFHNFYRAYEAEILNLDCHLVTKYQSYYTTIDKITILTPTNKPDEFYGREALQKGKIFIGQRGFCGIMALSYAVALGYNIIYLLGYDFGNISTSNGKRTHYFDDNMADYGIKRGYENPRYTVFVDKNGKVKTDVKDFQLYSDISDLKIYNVSLESNIPYFEKISYEDFFDLIKKEESNET